jgi:hypothetical protein
MVAPAVRDHVHAFAAACRDEFRALVRSEQRLVAEIAADDPVALRFAQHWGFRIGGEVGGFVRAVLETATERLPPGPPFVIHSLGRSRSAWLSQFLSYGGWACHHEQAVRMRSFDDVRALFSRRRTGTAETAAAPGWPLLKQLVPGIRAAVVRRPIDDVVASMMALDLRGFAYDRDALHRNISYVARTLDRISAEPGVLTLDYSDLETEAGCGALFRHCLGAEMPRAWWVKKRSVNVQMDVPALIRYYHDNRAEVDGFKALCKSEMRALARSGILRRAAA